ncbi:MAG TPA: hypothetical protein VLA80_14420, partial [Actinomycetota bacterium]|nr:hypothetical protein [Actinomycetota bacterium]
MSELPPGPPDGYALGRSDAETRRLIAQHPLYGPFSRQFLVAAGITAGIDTLEDRLRAGVVGQDSVQLLPAVVGA